MLLFWLHLGSREFPEAVSVLIIIHLQVEDRRLDLGGNRQQPHPSRPHRGEAHYPTVRFYCFTAFWMYSGTVGRLPPGTMTFQVFFAYILPMNMGWGTHTRYKLVSLQPLPAEA